MREADSYGTECQPIRIPGGHSELSTLETQHYFTEQDFVAIGNKWVTGRILGITRRFFYFDAFLGRHKKSREWPRLDSSSWQDGLEQASESGNNSLTSALVGGRRVNGSRGDALVSEGLLNHGEVYIGLDQRIAEGMLQAVGMTLILR
jgi:hypothetical protein